MMKAADILTKLEGEVAPTTFDMLLPHLERGALVQARKVPLVPVALSIALDRAGDLERWIDRGDVVPSAGLSKDAWPNDTPVDMVIVQPYVVFRIRLDDVEVASNPDHQ